MIFCVLKNSCGMIIILPALILSKLLARHSWQVIPPGYQCFTSFFLFLFIFIDLFSKKLYLSSSSSWSSPVISLGNWNITLYDNFVYFYYNFLASQPLETSFFEALGKDSQSYLLFPSLSLHFGFICCSALSFTLKKFWVIYFQVRYSPSVTINFHNVIKRELKYI